MPHSAWLGCGCCTRRSSMLWQCGAWLLVDAATGQRSACKARRAPGPLPKVPSPKPAPSYTHRSSAVPGPTTTCCGGLLLITATLLRPVAVREASRSWSSCS